jgi:hypothetical protein
VRFNNGYNIFHAHPHLVCAVQYANAVPENEKHEKRVVLRICGGNARATRILIAYYLISYLLLPKI